MKFCSLCDQSLEAGVAAHNSSSCTAKRFPNPPYHRVPNTTRVRTVPLTDLELADRFVGSSRYDG